MRKAIIFTIGSMLMHLCLLGQRDFQIEVDASQVIGAIEPLWGDHWEYHLLHGYGGNPSTDGPHQQYLADPNFASEMARLQPRYIRHSIGAFTNPPSTDYYSADTTILKNLWTEFYRGANTLTAANEMSNYHFGYLDSLVKVMHAIGAEVFLVLDYMPFTLSSNKIPLPAGNHLLAWDNGIRTAPPSDVEVFGRVMYQVVKYAHEQLGVDYFEIWNEPDQFPLNTYFFKGTATDLFEMYEATIRNIEIDVPLADNIEIGCCSFALNSFLNLFPIDFLTRIRDNNVRLDFLSFHPYNSIGAGYSSESVEIATQWRSDFVPEADLINAEWGRLGFDFGTANWKSLEYGLDKAAAMIDMNNRGIKMAHAATLVSIDNDDGFFESCCIGIFEVNPIKPKGSAYTYFYLNRLLETPNRLMLDGTGSTNAIAGINETQTKIVIILSAPRPESDLNTVQLRVENLPWSGNSKIERYELTEEQVADDDLHHLVFSTTGTEPLVSDSVTYEAVQDGGRLIVWEITKTDVTSTRNFIAETVVYPNPSTGQVNIDADEKIKLVQVYAMNGVLIREEEADVANYSMQLEKGIYLVKVFSRSSVDVQKICIY